MKNLRKDRRFIRSAILIFVAGIITYFAVRVIINLLNPPIETVYYEKYEDTFVMEEYKDKESNEKEVRELVKEEILDIDSVPEGQYEGGIAFKADTEKQGDTPVIGGGITFNPYAGRKEQVMMPWFGKDVKFDVAIGKVNDKRSIMKVDVPADGQKYKLEMVKKIACRRWRVDYYKNGKYHNSRFYDRFEIEGIDSNIIPVK